MALKKKVTKKKAVKKKAPAKKAASADKPGEAVFRRRYRVEDKDGKFLRYEPIRGFSLEEQDHWLVQKGNRVGIVMKNGETWIGPVFERVK